MDIPDDIGSGQREYVVVSGEVDGVLSETVPSKIIWREISTLYFGAHCSVDDENVLSDRCRERLSDFRHVDFP